MPMYYTRLVPVTRIMRALMPAAAIVVVVPLTAQQLPSDLASLARFIANHQVVREQATIGDVAIDITLTVPADAASADTAALLSATNAALTRLDAWLGPFPVPALTVIDAPWRVGVAGASYPGVAVTSSRWLTTARDPAVERQLFAALARQYTFSISSPGDAQAPFEEGLALYLGTRLIHEQLHSRNFETPRFFGGFIPFSVRSVLNSRKPEDQRPQLQHLADVERPADSPWRAASAAPGAPSQRVAALLQTCERHFGWPTFQLVLEQFFSRFRGRAATPADFSAVASEVIGQDVSGIFGPAILAGREFDYVLAELRSDAGDGRFTTTVVVRRVGVELPVVGGVPLLVRFEDGAAIIERVNTRDIEQTFVYRGPARAIAASVDPDAVLIVDANRENNTRTFQPRTDPIGIRLALHWIMWLQDAMFAHTALL
jgi:hypothetical protein